MSKILKIRPAVFEIWSLEKLDIDGLLLEFEQKLFICILHYQPMRRSIANCRFSKYGH